MNSFCEKNALKFSNFEDKIYEITLFRQQVPTQKYSKSFKNLYFLI